MVKAACQCKGRDAAMAVVRILGPPLLKLSLAVRTQAAHLRSNHIAERNWWPNCHRARNSSARGLPEGTLIGGQELFE